MLKTPEKPRAARRDPDGSPGRFDHVWQRVRAECNREAAKAQIASSPIDHPLPMVRAALQRDHAARAAYGMPPNSYVFMRRPDYAEALAKAEFAEAPRRRVRR